MATKASRKLRIRLTDEEHDRMNRFRNHVNVLMGYGIIVLLSLTGLLLFVGLVIRAAIWAFGGE